MIKFYIKTYGCQANVADSQAIFNFLEDKSCIGVKTEKDADLIIINTCAIREKAEQKVYSYIGSLIKIQRDKPYLKVIVIGCIASYRKKEFYSRFPSIDFVFGAKEDKFVLQNKLIDLILSLQTIKKNFSYGNFKRSDIIKYDLRLGGLKKEKKSLRQSFINIMTGCNNFCSYCIVPFTRGREISYSSGAILERIRTDVLNGAKEIFLLGQNVNSYKDPENGLNFSQLLNKIANIPGNFWVRFMSPHPKDMTLDVIKVIAKYSDKLCSFIHHPLQSGSNIVLENMNRGYTIEKYLEQIDWIRKYLPLSTISTDIIVGFPGETETDFKKTMKVIEEIRFNNVFSFIYSPRKYTKAFFLTDNCSYEIKQKRLNFLQRRQVEIAKEKHEVYIGKILQCLVEKRVTNAKLLARSAGNHRILVDGDDSIINTFVNIKVTSAGAVNLEGILN